MKYIILNSIMSKLMPFNKVQTKTILGRWSIDTCQKIRNIKIDQSNEDHCGTCHQYKHTVIKSQKKTPNKIIDIEFVKY